MPKSAGAGALAGGSSSICTSRWETKGTRPGVALAAADAQFTTLVMRRRFRPAARAREGLFNALSSGHVPDNPQAGAAVLRHQSEVGRRPSARSCDSHRLRLHARQCVAPVPIPLRLGCRHVHKQAGGRLTFAAATARSAADSARAASVSTRAARPEIWPRCAVAALRGGSGRNASRASRWSRRAGPST